jgi:FtsP/CotA-like multicopper oxidase with cupredoxin domain
MSRNQRIGLIVAALAVAVVAFIVAQPGDDNNGSKTSENQSGDSSAPSQSVPADSAPPVARISVKAGVLVGDAQTIRVAKNDIVRIVVSSDVPDQIHLHGYDIEKEAAPGKPARFRFKADAEGAFVLESHAAEDAGEEPLLAHLLVGPS